MKTHQARFQSGRIGLFFTTIIFLLLTGACNFPRSQEETAPDSNIIASVVAQTLTAQPTVEIPKQVTPPTTPSPSAITIITLPAPETPSPTPTQAEDFKTALGSPSVKDTLDTGKGFGISGSGYSDDAASINVSGGFMNLLSYSTVGWRTWRVRPPQIANFYLEGKFITQNCARQDQFGLVFRAPNYESGFGYYLGFRCDGSLSFARWDDNGTTFLLNDVSSSSSLTGAGQTNLLGVLASGNHFKLYVNDKPFQELDDNSFNEGYFGVFIAGYSGNLNVQLDEITLWKQ